MKNIFTLLISFFILGSLSAQNIFVDKTNTTDGFNILSDEMKEKVWQMKKQSATLFSQGNKTQALSSFFVDYEFYDSSSFNEFDSGIYRVHSGFNTSDLVFFYDDYDPTLIVDTVFWKFSRAATAFKWLNETYYGFDIDGNALTPLDSTTHDWSTATVTIDTVFYTYGHVMNSTVTNEIRTRLLPIGSDGRPDYSATPLFTDIVSTDSSLTGPGTDPGTINLAVASIPVNLTLAAGTNGVAVAVDMMAGDKLVDEFFLLGSMPTNCTVADDLASDSRFYPNSYKSVVISDVFGVGFVNGYQPNAAGSYNFGYDLDNDGIQSEDCEKFFIQDWSIWMKVTADIPLGLNVSVNNNSVCEGDAVTLSAQATGAVDPVDYEWTTTGSGIFVSPTAAVTDVVVSETATYTVTATDATGAVVTTDIEVIVDDIAVNVAGDIEVPCGTAQAQLIAQATSSVDNNYTYNWSFINESDAIINVVPGTYTVSVMNGNGCSATETISVGFTDSALQSDFDYDNAYSSVVNFINQSTSAGSYVWDFGDGNISSSENPSNYYASGGQYVVKLSAFSNSCIHETLKTVAVGINTGVEDVIGADLKLYPNPATELYNIQVNSHTSDLIEVSIYNVNGEQQYAVSEMNSLNDIVDLNDFAAGIYFVNIKINELQSTHKLVVNK